MMKVRSGLPLWRGLYGDPPQFLASTGDATCDVVILGGGVTGALVAHHLVAAGVNAILVDKGEPASGSSAASTGLLQYEVDTPLADLAARVGEANAVHAYRRGLRAIDELEALLENLDDRCGFSRRDSLYFASRRWHYRRLKREFEYRKHHGFDVQLLSRGQLAERFSIRSVAAIHSTGDGQVDPYRFTIALLRKAQSQGLRIYPNTRVDSIDEDEGGVVVNTAAGKVAARRIVYAVGYESDQYLDRRVGSLQTTYAVASEPLRSTIGWPDGCLLWETARPYFYARQSHDGRAIIGGEDTAFARDHQREGLAERKTARLVARFQKLFPAIEFEPAFTWAGTFGESKDGLAYIGQPPGRPNAYFAIGYGGNGITFSVIAARLIADLYFEKPNADAKVFRFGR